MSGRNSDNGFTYTEGDKKFYSGPPDKPVVATGVPDADQAAIKKLEAELFPPESKRSDELRQFRENYLAAQLTYVENLPAHEKKYATYLNRKIDGYLATHHVKDPDAVKRYLLHEVYGVLSRIAYGAESHIEVIDGEQFTLKELASIAWGMGRELDGKMKAAGNREAISTKDIALNEDNVMSEVIQPWVRELELGIASRAKKTEGGFLDLDRDHRKNIARYQSLNHTISVYQSADGEYVFLVPKKRRNVDDNTEFDVQNGVLKEDVDVQVAGVGGIAGIVSGLGRRESNTDLEQRVTHSKRRMIELTGSRAGVYIDVATGKTFADQGDGAWSVLKGEQWEDATLDDLKK